MEAGKLNLRLPLNAKQLIDQQKTERTTSHTDLLVDSALSANAAKTANTPKFLQSSSLKTLTSANKLKDTLQKTSEKLKFYQTKTEPIKISYNSTESYSEISKLKREVRILEAEKLELENANRKLQESLSIYKETSTMSEDSSSSLLRYGKFFLAKVKEDLAWGNSFRDIFDTEDAFTRRLSNEHSSSLSLGLLQFILEIAEKPFSSKPSQRSLGPNFLTPKIRTSEFSKGLNDDSIRKIFKESINIAETITAQRLKIEQAYESVRETVGISRGVSANSNYSRPSSSATANESQRASGKSALGFLKRSDSIDKE